MELWGLSKFQSARVKVVSLHVLVPEISEMSAMVPCGHETRHVSCRDDDILVAVASATYMYRAGERDDVVLVWVDYMYD